MQCSAPTGSIRASIPVAAEPRHARDGIVRARHPCAGKSRSAKGARSFSDRPVRALIKPAVVETYFPLDELGLIVFELERIDVSADQEQPALSGIDVRGHAVEQVLINQERADPRGGPGGLRGINGVHSPIPPEP